MTPKIKLVALDLDGTLFNSKGIITEKTKKEIKRATDQGTYVIISTGRPYNGLPFEQIEGLGMQYAITSNGAAIYHIPDHQCIYEDGMDLASAKPLLAFILEKDIHLDIYIGGKGITPTQCRKQIHRLNIPQNLLEYMLKTRTPVDNLMDYVQDCGKKIQKITMNFYPQSDGTLLHRKDALTFFANIPSIECVCGGFNNLELTKTGINKGTALTHLASYLQLDIQQTMAIGDNENDLSILKAAGIGVAMGNSTDLIKSIANYVTDTNEADGVQKAIAHFIPSSDCQ